MSNLAAAPVAQDVRRKAELRDKGEEFGIALEAQVSAAGVARGSEESDSSRAAVGAAAAIDPTFAAVEQLATRSEHAPGGLKREVQDEMNSVKSEGDDADGDTGQRASERDTVKREAGSPGLNGEVHARSTLSLEEPAATNFVARAQSGAVQSAAATEPAKPGEIPGKNAMAATGVAMSNGSAITGTSRGQTGSGNERGNGGNAAGRPHVSAADALGALGRKTIFKVVTTEKVAQGADMDKFVTQASKALAAAVKREGGTVVMRLNPENLGLLKVRVETKEGHVNARVEASESSARKLLTEDIESLRSALEAHGVCVEKIEIVRMDDLQGLNAEGSKGSGTDQASGTDLGNSGRQAEDRQRDAAESTDAKRGFEDASEFMDEPAGVYLCGVELRVDAIA